MIRLVLVSIEGAPGIGKSTFSWELCRQWQNMSTLQNFSLMVLLRLREEWVQKATHISDLFYHKDEQPSRAVGKKVEQREGEGVLFILDGYDEFPTDTCENLKFLRGLHYLPKSTNWLYQ